MHGGFEVDSILHSKALGNFGKNYDDTAKLVLQICRPTNWKLLLGCSEKEIENEGPFILETCPIFCCSVDLRVSFCLSIALNQDFKKIHCVLKSVNDFTNQECLRKRIRIHSKVSVFP